MCVHMRERAHARKHEWQILFSACAAAEIWMAPMLMLLLCHNGGNPRLEAVSVVSAAFFHFLLLLGENIFSHETNCISLEKEKKKTQNKTNSK